MEIHGAYGNSGDTVCCLHSSRAASRPGWFRTNRTCDGGNCHCERFCTKRTRHSLNSKKRRWRNGFFLCILCKPPACHNRLCTDFLHGTANCRFLRQTGTHPRHPRFDAIVIHRRFQFHTVRLCRTPNDVQEALFQEHRVDDTFEHYRHRDGIHRIWRMGPCRTAAFEYVSCRSHHVVRRSVASAIKILFWKTEQTFFIWMETSLFVGDWHGLFTNTEHHYRKDVLARKPRFFRPRKPLSLHCRKQHQQFDPSSHAALAFRIPRRQAPSEEDGATSYCD